MPARWPHPVRCPVINTAQFYTPYHFETRIIENQQFVFLVIDDVTGARQRGMNNNHQGVFLDDFVIGFAARGEMVTGHYNPNVIIDDPEGVEVPGMDTDVASTHQSQFG